MNTRYYLLFICCLFLQHFVSAQILYTPKGNTFRGIIRTNELSSTEKNNIYNYIQDNLAFSNKSVLPERIATDSLKLSTFISGKTKCIYPEKRNVIFYAKTKCA